MNIREAKAKVKHVLSDIPAVMGVGIYIGDDKQASLVINIDEQRLRAKNQSFEEIQRIIDRKVRQQAALRGVNYTIQLLEKVQFQEAHSIF